MRDFEVNYTRGQEAPRGREPLSDLGRSLHVQVLSVLGPSLRSRSSLLPLPAAKALWYALTVLSLDRGSSSSRSASSGSRKGAAPWYLLAIPPLVLAKFFVVEIKLGQINALVTLVFALHAPAAERSARGGSLGTGDGDEAVRPHLPTLLCGPREVRSPRRGLAVLAGAFLLPSAFYGFERNLEVHREWYRTLSESTPRGARKRRQRFSRRVPHQVVSSARSRDSGSFSASES